MKLRKEKEEMERDYNDLQDQNIDLFGQLEEGMYTATFEDAANLHVWGYGTRNKIYPWFRHHVSV